MSAVAVEGEDKAAGWWLRRLMLVVVCFVLFCEQLLATNNTYFVES